MATDKNASETVRINSDLKRRVEEIAGKIRPRSTIQYVIEAAIEDYLAKEERAGYHAGDKKSPEKSH